MQRSDGPHGPFQHRAAIQTNPRRLRNACQRQHAIRPARLGDFQRVSAGKSLLRQLVTIVSGRDRFIRQNCGLDLLAQAHQRSVILRAHRLFDEIDTHRRQLAAAFRAGGGIPGLVNVNANAGAIA